MTIDELRKKCSDLLAEARGIHEAAEKDKRALTDEERVKFDGLLSEIDQLKADITRQERLAGVEGWASETPTGSNVPRPVSTEQVCEKHSLGIELQAIARRGGYRGRIEPEAEKRASGLNEAIGSQGGFLLQPTYTSEILTKTYGDNPVLGLCRRQELGANSDRLVIRAINETSRAAGSRFGGCRFYWLDEAAAKSDSKPEFRKMEWQPKKVAALWYATDELLQDATALTGIANEVFGSELAFEVTNTVINGTGAGQPLGIMNSPALVTVAAEAGQGATTILAQNILKMWSRCWAASRRNAVWLINQDIEPQLFAFGIGVGVGGGLVYTPANGLAGQPYSTLFGRPVIPIEQCATLGTTGDIILADLSEYLIVDKGAPQTAESIHLRFNYDETTFRMVYRVDGMPLWNSTLTPASGSGNTLSPFVVLASRT